MESRSPSSPGHEADSSSSESSRHAKPAMNIPRFPAPPAPVLRSVSLDNRELGTATPEDSQLRRRPRSASWLVARRQARRSRRRGNHIQPIAPSELKQRLSAELVLTMTESRVENSEDKEKALERIREGGSPQSAAEEDCQAGEEDEVKAEKSEVICGADAESQQRVATPSPARSVDPIPEQPLQTEEAAIVAPVSSFHVTTTRRLKSSTAQTDNRVLYRLRVFPTLKDIVDAENKPPDLKKPSRLFRYFRFLGRIALCQFGLAWLLTLWAVLGAGAFYITEGPRERQQVVELKDMQRDLAVGLATELRQLKAADDKELEPLWSSKVRQYVARHEKLLLIAVSSGYGEGGDNGQLWTLPGCVLFAISVLTTLGFGAPVPRTNAGRTVCVIFATIGIPAHFILMLNLGLLCAVRLKRYGVKRKYPQEARDLETIDTMPMPMWVKIAPFLAMAVYYIFGILCFGAGRRRPFSDSLLFPLDFTAAGGLSTIAGYVRILYGVYLEGAVTLAAIGVAVLKVSATQSLTNIGLKYGLLVPA